MMNRGHIDLDRRSASQGKKRSLGYFRSRAPGDGDLSWAKLLALPRVVVLAEAGSGKSWEFTQQCRKAIDNGELACRASVQDVARAGLVDALGHPDLKRFERWRRAGDQKCFLFIDSVDEAKDEGYSFESALRNWQGDRPDLKTESRYSFCAALPIGTSSPKDSDAMEGWLAVPSQGPPPIPDLEQQIRDTLHHRPQVPTPAAAPKVTIVQMARFYQR